MERQTREHRSFTQGLHVPLRRVDFSLGSRGGRAAEEETSKSAVHGRLTFHIALAIFYYDLGKKETRWKSLGSVATT